MEASFLSQIVLPFSLFIIMWGMGLSLKISDFSRVLAYPKAATVGILSQMLMLPFVGYVIVLVFGLNTEVAVGLLILTFCPGGVTSNMFSYLAKGDTALSISLTALVSVITPFTIPVFSSLAMQLFMSESQQFSMPILKTIVQLLVITVLPVALGMVCHRRFPNFSAKAEKPVKVFSMVFLFAIIASIIAKEWQNIGGYFAQTGVATLCLNLITLVLGFIISMSSGLKKNQAISISMEVGIQNGTLALLVSGTILQSALMTVPAITYSLIMFATGALFGWLINKIELKRLVEET